MSFVTDHLRLLDAFLDRQQPRSLPQRPASRSSLAAKALSRSTTTASSSHSPPVQTHISRRVELVEQLIKSVTDASSNQAILPIVQLRELISRASVDPLSRTASTTSLTGRSRSGTLARKGHSRVPSRLFNVDNGRQEKEGDNEDGDNFDAEGGEYGEELEWLLASKVAAQVQALLLNRLLDEITPVMDDMYYWDGVLASWNGSALYTVQRLPSRLWAQGREALAEARENLATLRDHGVFGGDGRANNTIVEQGDGEEQGDSTAAVARSAFGVLGREWRTFYDLVRESIRDRQLNDIQTRLLSPVSAARMDARQRLKGLGKQKQMCAAAIGVLTNESLNPRRMSQQAASGSLMRSNEWREHLASSVQLMTATISQVSYVNVEPKAYEQTVLRCLDGTRGEVDGVQQIYDQLTELLVHILPQHAEAYREGRIRFGKPSRWIRYWLPASVLLVSSSTLLRILVRRQADIVTWIRDFGKTTIAFWQNWVVDPISDIVKTIRHDKESEIALMSRESLESDRASLERMVVDFAVENPETAGMRPPLDEATIELIRQGVKEGNLTPILRAYEHDLKRPIARAIMGNLVRELLIQIQKTKVDVELAMSGIDSLLKSQELVFGFVGLTPGILVCVLVGRWLSDVFGGGRRGRAHGHLQGRLIRVIRNIDRILSNAEPQDHDRLLSYKDHGLVLCEVQVLRANSGRVLPGEINKEFLEDVKELTDIHLGIERHIKVVDRLRWAYWKWLK